MGSLQSRERSNLREVLGGSSQKFDLWYGLEDVLEAWHALCRAVGIPWLDTCCINKSLVSAQILLKYRCILEKLAYIRE
ncbi:hypothetical protein DM02DRAFT_33654 [Periconia macrospinosa]|uniref:Uncharacterized protein n=1 Tax=Periconia macrospinosa TaxID=97972 RepID=A0A2V1CYU4_9PLEO|nr:hypothetical protein DM02DRAFT_33654 [Periconia macrospinosa]